MRVTSKVLSVLCDSRLFRGCDRREVAACLERDDVQLLKETQGGCLQSRGSDKHFLGILLRGSARVERTSKDGRMHMSYLREGDLFGAASVFCGASDYVVDIRCGTECRALCIPEEALLDWMTAHPLILKNYLGYLNERIRFLNSRLDALSKSTVAAKLLSYFATEEKDGVVTVKSYTELAETLCLSRPTLYRALDTLSESGMIRREGKRILLTEETVE